MQYRHIELYLVGVDEPGAVPTLADVRAMVTVQFAKGSKDRPGENQVRHLQPLSDPSCQDVCPITLLPRHALRHGVVKDGSTLTRVLDVAKRRTDRLGSGRIPTAQL